MLYYNIMFCNTEISMISLENLIDHQYAHLGWMTIAYKSEKYDEIFAYMNFNMDLKPQKIPK
jgi:hypothetical protein